MDLVFLENGGVIHKKVDLPIENQGEEKSNRVIGRRGDHNPLDIAYVLVYAYD